MLKDSIKQNTFRIFNTIVFVVFCFLVGEGSAILLTCLIYDVSILQVSEAIKQPISNRSLIISLLSFSTIFRFLVIPTIYLLFTDKSSLNFLRTNSKIRFTPLLLTIILVFSIIPINSILIELNYEAEFPTWLSEFERYFKEIEESAAQLMNFLLSFRDFKDLIIAILIFAIIPGVAEEFFFRGLVQMQLQNVLKNDHYAIFLSTFLFSFSHFQFYGFIPRMVLGLLFGYIFFWSKNIWFPSTAHVTNNLVVVLGAYFFGPQIINPESGFKSIMFLFPSVLISILIIVYLKRNLNTS